MYIEIDSRVWVTQTHSMQNRALQPLFAHRIEMSAQPTTPSKRTLWKRRIRAPHIRTYTYDFKVSCVRMYFFYSRFMWCVKQLHFGFVVVLHNDFNIFLVYLGACMPNTWGWKCVKLETRHLLCRRRRRLHRCSSREWNERLIRAHMITLIFTYTVHNMSIHKIILKL